MRIGIIVPIFNRPQYLADTLWSLERVILPEGTVIMLINDASTDQQAKRLFNEFKHPTAYVQRDIAPVNMGIQKCLNHGYEDLFGMFKCDLVINFDSDAVIRPDAVEKLSVLYRAGLDGALLTGFHSTTLNANGSERHSIITQNEYFYKKKSVGGINFCIDRQAYELYMKPALLKVGNFDHNACINAGGAYCLKESVVQHIGFDSSLGHYEQPDVADDFYYWDLPTVTLIGVDNQQERLRVAADKCTKWIKFGDVKLLHPNISSKEQYSEFCILELYKHVSTEHMLIFQHDGFVHNWKVWDNDWLQYDYIGAPWHYNDGMAVGNGGFSLRSRRLMEILATDPEIKFTHPEDHHICRTYRSYLETKYGIKFAPLEVAEKFSYEGYMQPGTVLTDQFGVHGMGRQVTKLRSERYVVNQFRGLGDILFLVPLVRALMNEGNSVIWPIVSEYMNIAKHFPDIDFRDKETVQVDYNCREMRHASYGKILPYRFAMECMGRGMVDCMRSKYEIYGHNHNMWRNLYWKRFPEREKKLAEMVGANSGKYILVNRYYGEASRGMMIEPVLPDGMPVVEMKTIEGFSLLDWSSIIEGASEIHTANTSLLYVLEILHLTMPIHFYKRGLWGEQSYEHTDYLYTKHYILH